MRTKEIIVSLSGTIGTAPYENYKPGFSITMELIDGDDEELAFQKARDTLRNLMQQEVNRAKVDLIEKQYSNMRFRERNGKKYPSVTSILNWDKEWAVTEDQLRQYASRGTIVHKILEIYLKEGKWVDPNEVKELKEDIAILMGGSMGFHWNDCSYKAFMEKHRELITVEMLEKEIYNDELLYSGRYDIKGMYDGKKSIMDFKTGTSWDMRQLAAYAICEPDIEQLVILPVGATTNKCGYMKPIICDTVQNEFKEFAKARAKFKERFGI
jgi:hypothetical protein